jgi:hypothetical protein
MRLLKEMITAAIMVIEKTLVNAAIQVEEETIEEAVPAVEEITEVAAVPEITGAAAIQAATIVILKKGIKIVQQFIIPRQGLFQCRGFILTQIYLSALI